MDERKREVIFAEGTVVNVLQQMVKRMVREPNEARVLVSIERRCLVLDVVVAPGDVGRIIGRGGQTARAIRTIVDTMATTAGERYELNLPRGGGRKQG